MDGELRGGLAHEPPGTIPSTSSHLHLESAAWLWSSLKQVLCCSGYLCMPVFSLHRAREWAQPLTSCFMIFMILAYMEDPFQSVLTQVMHERAGLTLFCRVMSFGYVPC